MKIRVILIDNLQKMQFNGKIVNVNDPDTFTAFPGSIFPIQGSAWTQGIALLDRKFFPGDQ